MRFYGNCSLRASLYLKKKDLQITIVEILEMLILFCICCFPKVEKLWGVLEHFDMWTFGIDIKMLDPPVIECPALKACRALNIQYKNRTHFQSILISIALNNKNAWLNRSL